VDLSHGPGSPPRPEKCPMNVRRITIDASGTGTEPSGRAASRARLPFARNRSAPQATRTPRYPADAGDAQQQRHVGLIGAAGTPVAVDLIDLALEVLDQLEAGVDGARQGCGIASRSSSCRPATPNRSVTRARVPERDQRRVDAVLEHRTVLDQMQPEPRSRLRSGRLSSSVRVQRRRRNRPPLWTTNRPK
jgi:hypothetical protein